MHVGYKHEKKTFNVTIKLNRSPFYPTLLLFLIEGEFLHNIVFLEIAIGMQFIFQQIAPYPLAALYLTNFAFCKKISCHVSTIDTISVAKSVFTLK